MEETPIKLSVLVYREGKFFLARCLENNLIAQALNFNELEERVKALILAQIKRDREKSRPLFYNKTTAPKSFFALYEAASKVHVENHNDLPNNINATLALSF